jgi:thiosulfate dehydrogenase [quinone] large subunit
LTRPDLPRLALLPLRFFFGVTFLWAGLDKLLDPAFLDPAATTSLHAQLLAFARVSPLGEIINASLPYSVEVGLLVAIAEIGIGIGALTGLAFRVAAAGGFVLSIFLWLTASWSVHPYYLGADLPYAFGWLTLLIAGHGGILVPRRVLGATAGDSAAAEPEAVPSPARRLFSQTVAIGAIAVAVAAVAGSLRWLGVLVGGGSAGGGSAGGTPSASPTAIGSPAIGASRGPAATIPANAIPVAQVADVTRNGAAAFTIPFDAPAPLPAGDPGVIVELADGTFVAFDAVCTHAGCTVEWSANDKLLVCPCHDAMFDPERHAAVLDGPAPSPLSSLPLFVDAASGAILLVPSA